jgi:hypothetical protein
MGSALAHARGHSPQKARSGVRRRICHASQAADGADGAPRFASARSTAPSHSADGRTETDQRLSPRIARPGRSRTIHGIDPGCRKGLSSCGTVVGESSSVCRGVRDLAGRRDGIVRRAGDLRPGVDRACARDRHGRPRRTARAAARAASHQSRCGGHRRVVVSGFPGAAPERSRPPSSRTSRRVLPTAGR